MIGAYRRGPKIILSLPGWSEPLDVEFTIDTGFEGELSLPPHLARQIAGDDGGMQSVRLATGLTVAADFYSVEIEWHGAGRIIEMLVLEGNPLLGLDLMRGSLLSVAMEEGGDVSIEPL